MSTTAHLEHDLKIANTNLNSSLIVFIIAAAITALFYFEILIASNSTLYVFFGLLIILVIYIGFRYFKVSSAEKSIEEAKRERLEYLKNTLQEAFFQLTSHADFDKSSIAYITKNYLLKNWNTVYNTDGLERNITQIKDEYKKLTS